jgi:hypothetical protein
MYDVSQTALYNKPGSTTRRGMTHSIPKRPEIEFHKALAILLWNKR